MYERLRLMLWKRAPRGYFSQKKQDLRWKTNRNSVGNPGYEYLMIHSPVTKVLNIAVRFLSYRLFTLDNDLNFYKWIVTYRDSISLTRFWNFMFIKCQGLTGETTEIFIGDEFLYAKVKILRKCNIIWKVTWRRV